MFGFTAWQAGKLTAICVSIAVAFLVLQLVYFYAIVAWGDQRTRGLRYYGRRAAERETFKRLLYLHSIALSPIIWLLSRVSRFTFRNGSFSYRGVAGPKGNCSVDSFRRAAQYKPSAGDVFVATQMRCGTTWMQHIVYQVLTRGTGDLSGAGTALYAVSPWLESLKTVATDDAPLVGTQRPSRIIKTHLPTQLCPYNAEAKYIYVTRHPLSCFASCMDFVSTNLGPFVPPPEDFEAWFRSDELMWWGTWPAHVRGWWEWSQRRANVLFVCFEEMRKDLPATVWQVAEFLQIERLGDEELAQIAHKCSFDYMREHADAFEMNPPHLLQSWAAFFVGGKADRHKEVPEALRQRILTFCSSEMVGSSFPLRRFYADVADGQNTAAGQ